MKKVLNSIIITTVFSVALYAQTTEFDTFFEQADTFFAAYVKDGKVAYREIQSNPDQLNQLLEMIANSDLEQASKNEQKAFLINTYNILTIHSIIGNGIPASPLDVEGFFNEQTHTVAGREVTLDQVEKEMLLPNFNDARLHFVLVCAATGCPPLKSFAYVPGKLDEQIQESTEAALNSSYFTRVKSEENKVLVSELFNWYKQDFLAEAESILDYINTFRNEKIPESYEVDYYTYDWSLNDRQ